MTQVQVCSSAPERACCLAWSLTRATQARIDAHQLRGLHAEVLSCAELVGAEAIEVGATHGVLVCRKPAGALITTVDTMVRLGQLIIRWACSEEPEVGIRVGVHKGEVHWIELPDQHVRGYFGTAVSMSKHLAEIAPKDCCVHVTSATKQSLRVLERMRFSVSMNLPIGTALTSSYYLEPWEEAKDEEHDEEHGHKNPTVNCVSTMGSVLPTAQKGMTLGSSVSKMSVEEFAEFLEKHGVDPTKFGRGAAKTLANFHREIAVEQRSYLFKTGNELERRMELVRLELVAEDTHGTDKCLMLASEEMDDGRVRTRNQKLAVVVPEGISWQEAVKMKFLNIFGLTEDVQKATLSVEGNDFKEETLASASVPGLQTTYLTHEIRMRVLVGAEPSLKAVGLPGFEPFSTDASGEGAKQSWIWQDVGEKATDSTEALFKLLNDHAINVAEFEAGALNDLVEEVYTAKVSTLMLRGKELQRHLQIIKVWLTADILSVPHVLVHVYKMSKGKRDTKIKDRPISMRLNHGQRWREALAVALSSRLGLNSKSFHDFIEIDEASYCLCEEVEYSRSYPGLKTVYRIHEITCRVSTSATQLGLPTGQDFAISRRMSSAEDDVSVTHFTWKARKDFFGRQGRFQKSLLDVSAADDSKEVDPKRRLLAPAPLGLPANSLQSRGCIVVQELMKSKRTDWKRAKNAAKRIRDKDYTLKEFFDDCVAAFPELALYMGLPGPDGKTPVTSSGRSADDEYQRSVGALFAVYWLMRLNGDGAQSFCFGVDDDWKPLSAACRSPRRSGPERARRGTFLEQTDWKLFEEVMVASGMLIDQGKGVMAHDEERTLAMLVLTAIHDIMKVDQLMPTVAARQKEFCGYKSGEVITDHDVALGYILEHVPDALPSYAGLPQKQKDSVKFTQCNMEYNMGWLVQAESPPGALFRKFKAIITAGKADPRDIAFYFTHWLTDLAGAEPCPQEGCEKFVLKFPQKVLASFLRSFPFVEHLSGKSETKVMEEYLQWRWTTHEPSLGLMPIGSGVVAKLRVIIMAQGNSQPFLDAFDDLFPEDRTVLETELALTGCVGQVYDIDTASVGGGPAFLVYYAPALLQRNHTDAEGVLVVLAEVLRQARSLWPREQGQAAGETVTVLIDALKELSVEAMQQLSPGEIWVLQRVTSKSAQVKKLSVLNDSGQDAIDRSLMRVLSLGSPQGSSGGSTSRTTLLHGEQPVSGLLPVTQEEAEPLVREVAIPSCGRCMPATCCL
eukprot:CAMPEP_0115409812 /NCGR_PEP_ID=MMETSP0271-20121206/20199_1 /TAXON_ID=71861 /ORGANISM="Scrippsiella trochoidea, Strain CCMP3099" /LENGTH=1242 /DNA_ID=CAMNT_0002833975 /DNA_START=62 /DNA_END=3790 /DNA_ORIENTATION=+